MSTLDTESIITLNVKKTISEAKEDSIVLGTALICFIALIMAFYLMRQDLVVEARQQAADSCGQSRRKQIREGKKEIATAPTQL